MKKSLSFVFGLLAAFVLIIHPEIIFAQTPLQQANFQPPSVRDSTVGFGSSLMDAIKVIINFLLLFLGIIATAFVIYGGFLYVTSGGDDSKAESGKKILIQAAIGIGIILISYAFIHTLLGMGMNEPPETNL